MANAWALGELSYDEIAMVKLLFYTLIICPFLASSAFMSWSVGESLAREKFGEKLAALDAIINLQFSTKKFALSALRGYAYGFVALGLDAGEIFNQLLQEEKMQLHQGDLLVFYTDGFIEAMNHELCEYSEEKLINIVCKNRHKGSKEIINTIYTDVKKYIKNYPHYDDMTMIVVKIH